MVRPAGVADAAVLADIHVSSWQVAYRGVFEEAFLEVLDREGRADWFEKAIGRGTPIVVEPDDAPLGFCMYGESHEEGWAEVLSIYVHPDHWGQGHGRRLLRRAEVELAELGFSRVLLWVLDSNERARRFYERQGWTLGSRIKLEEMGGVQVTEVRYEVYLPGSS